MERLPFDMYYKVCYSLDHPCFLTNHRFTVVLRVKRFVLSFSTKNFANLSYLTLNYNWLSVAVDFIYFIFIFCPFVQGGVMQTHDEDTHKFFKHSSVMCVLSPRYAGNELSMVKQQASFTQLYMYFSSLCHYWPYKFHLCIGIWTVKQLSLLNYRVY